MDNYDDFWELANKFQTHNLTERVRRLEGELASMHKMVKVSKMYLDLWNEKEWLWDKLKFAEKYIDELEERLHIGVR